MSQIDYIHFLPSLVWTIVLFLGFYFFMITVFVPELYKIHRVRRNYLIKLANILKTDLYVAVVLHSYDLKLKESFFIIKLKGLLKLTQNKVQILLKCI